METHTDIQIESREGLCRYTCMFINVKLVASVCVHDYTVYMYIHIYMYVYAEDLLLFTPNLHMPTVYAQLAYADAHVPVKNSYLHVYIYLYSYM